MSDSQRSWAGALGQVVGLAGVAVAGLGAGAFSVATVFARRVLTPEEDRPDDVRIVAVEEHAVVLERDDVTRRPGRYGLWIDGGRGHVRA